MRPHTENYRHRPISDVHSTVNIWRQLKSVIQESRDRSKGMMVVVPRWSKFRWPKNRQAPAGISQRDNPCRVRENGLARARPTSGNRRRLSAHAGRDDSSPWGFAERPAPSVFHPIFAPKWDMSICFRDNRTLLPPQKPHHLFAPSQNKSVLSQNNFELRHNHLEL